MKSAKTTQDIVMQPAAKLQKQEGLLDLQTALRSCSELNGTKTLEKFILDLTKIPGAVTPSSDSLSFVKEDRNFRNFLQKVIVCTEPGYRPQTLESLAKEPARREYSDKYMELLSDIIKELLQEKKQHKLQTMGYTLDGDNLQTDELNSVKVNYINLNKQCMITRNWELVYNVLGDQLFSHLYKEYTIFL